MSKPNVLVFFTDQQRWDTTGVHGNPLDLTPNFDRLATHGTHVAIGVLWLTLMYVRTFKPAAGTGTSAWLATGIAHMAVFAAVIVGSLISWMAFTWK